MGICSITRDTVALKIIQMATKLCGLPAVANQSSLDHGPTGMGIDLLTGGNRCRLALSLIHI